MTWWKRVLVAVALVSWLAKLSLFYVSDIADWFWYLSLCCWFLLLVLAGAALLRRRLGELAILSLTLAITFLPALNIGAKPVEWFQERAFRVYALYRIRAVPLEEFLSSCKLIDYIEDDGAKRRVGQCDLGFRSTMWFRMSVIYDPTGQFGLPAKSRTRAWRWAVWDLNPGQFLIRTNEGSHLSGDFYFVLIGIEHESG